MRRSLKRLLGMMMVLPLFVVVAALVYGFLMTRVEKAPRTFWQCLEWAAGTVSTTGYGNDVSWHSPVLIVFVAAVQFAGVFLIFLVIPIYLVPFLEERFEGRLPRSAARLHNHVVIYRLGPAVETLLERLRRKGTPALVIETDERTARALLDRGINVVVTASDENALEVAQIERARALVANGRDEENAALILRARQMGFRGDIFALVEEPMHRKPMELAGATAAYTPRHIVAAALAARASARISPRISGLAAVPELVAREMRLPQSGPLSGRILSAAGLGARTGATVVGQWVRSELLTRCTGSMRLEEGAILVVVGDRDSVANAATILGATPVSDGAGFIIAGFGEVGRKVHELLTDAGESVRIIERQARPGVDVVGSVLDSSVLISAGLQEAQAVILALDSDDATLFATVIVRDFATSVPVIARVNHAKNIDNIHRAGADFALSLADVSGQMLSHQILGDRFSHHAHLALSKASGRSLAGRHLGELDMRQRGGCSIVAVARDGAIVTRLDRDFAFSPDDQVYVCGRTEDVKKVVAAL